MKTILIREIPEKLHKDFKRLCFYSEISMNQKLKELMEKAIKEEKNRHDKLT